MNWQDKGIVLSAKPWAEKYLLITLFASENGLSKGLIRTTKTLSHVQPGTIVSCTWKARLAEHLGTFTLDIEEIPFVRLFTLPTHLLFLKTVTSLLELALPERHPYPTLFTDVLRILSSLHYPHFPIYYEYAHLEFLLLKELGFEPDLTQCALCQLPKEIYYVSPKTGKGACFECGKVHAHKVFSFHHALFKNVDLDQLTSKHYQEAFQVTAHFLTQNVLMNKKGQLPMSRFQFIESLDRKAA